MMVKAWFGAISLSEVRVGQASFGRPRRLTSGFTCSPLVCERIVSVSTAVLPGCSAFGVSDSGQTHGSRRVLFRQARHVGLVLSQPFRFWRPAHRRQCEGLRQCSVCHQQVRQPSFPRVNRRGGGRGRSNPLGPGAKLANMCRMCSPILPASLHTYLSATGEGNEFQITQVFGRCDFRDRPRLKDHRWRDRRLARLNRIWKELAPWPVSIVLLCSEESLL